jgi:hypothetical protein
MRRQKREEVKRTTLIEVVTRPADNRAFRLLKTLSGPRRLPFARVR